MKSLSLVLIILFALLPAAAMAECTCELEGGEENGNKSLALKYKLAAFAAILVAGAFGVCLPVMGRTVEALSPERSFFFVLKAFSGGVILTTGFVHVLPDAFESLTSPCIGDRPWGDFPFMGFIAVVAAIVSLLVDAYAMSCYRRREAGRGAAAEVLVGDDGGDQEDRVQTLHTHTNELRRHRIIAQVLELGIIVHSLVIGIALGASQSPKTIRPLIVALSFHQLFEGIGLGGCITQAKFSARAVATMVGFFSLTTPVGIAIGIGIANGYSETSRTALIVQGMFNSASAGILAYLALVDLLSADFMSSRMQNSPKLMFRSTVALLLGAGCMSLLAKWA